MGDHGVDVACGLPAAKRLAMPSWACFQATTCGWAQAGALVLTVSPLQAVDAGAGRGGHGDDQCGLAG